MLEGGIQGFAEGADDEEPGEDAVLAVELERLLMASCPPVEVGEEVR